MQKKLLTIGLVAMMLLGSTLNVFAAGGGAPSGITNTTGGTNPTTLTIPVTASIDNYYIVSIPASAGLTLTQKYNDIYTSQNDTGATFYGILLVGVKGIIAADKKLDVNFGALTLKADESNTAVVKYGINQNGGWSETDLGIKDTAYDIAEVLDSMINEERQESDHPTNVDGHLTDTTTLTFDRTKYPVLADNSEWEYNGVLLRTDLPYTGTYTGNLGITFGLSDNQ